LESKKRSATRRAAAASISLNENSPSPPAATGQTRSPVSRPTAAHEIRGAANAAGYR
jgi:hypothetical protein